MTPDRYQKLMELLEEALDLTPPARSQLLHRVRSEDDGLADELAQLLEASDLECAALEPAAALSSAAALAASRGPAPLPDTEPSITGSRDAMAPFDELAGRWVLGERLGAGGAGVVYKALDQRTGQTVAVKLLSPSRLGDSNLQRFRREFRAISRLDHPGCLTVHEEGEQEGWRYIVMEYVAGGDLSAFIGADLRTILTILVQLVSSLDYVHSRRIVHRDLKPANVLVVRGEPPRPKLADFGIARMTGETLNKLTMTGVLIGTVDYLSPEQVQGDAASPRSDLYALGCMIFVLVSGRPPFEGSTFDRLVARTRSEAPRLSSVVPGVHAGLDQLVARLLAKEPMDRPQSALEVAHTLAAVLAELGPSALGAAEVADLLAPRAGGFLYAPTMAGRDAERASIRDFTRQSRPDAARVLVVCAAAGLGKSTLVDTVAGELAAAGALVVRAGLRGRATVPFAPFPELEHRLEHLAAGEVLEEEAPSAVRRIALQDADDAALAPRRLARRLLVRIDKVAGDGGAVTIILEDLHEADAGAIEVLSELMALSGASGTRRFHVVVTVRPEGRAMIERAFPGSASSSLQFLVLQPLGDDANRILAAAMLGCGQSALPPLLLEDLRANAGGNPLLLQHRLRAIVQAGHLRRVVGGWELLRDADTAPVLAPSALSLLRERLALFSARTSAVLRAAAFIGRDFDATLLTAVAGAGDSGVGADGVLDALDEALRAGVVADVGADAGSGAVDRWEFEHLGLVEALTLDVPAEEAARLHGAIGAVLLTRPGTPQAVLAHHLGRGPDPELGVVHLRRACEEALEAHDYAAARRHGADALVRVCELDGTSRAAVELAVSEALADAELALGSGERPRRLLEGLLSREALVPGAATRARLLRKLGRALFLTDQTRAGLETLERALEALGQGGARSRIGVFLQMGRDLLWTAFRRWFRRPTAATSARVEAALVHRELGTLHRWIDLERCARHVVAFLRESERLGDPRLLVDAWATWAFGLATMALPNWAGAAEKRAQQLALGTRDRPGLARLAMLRGGADVLVRGDFPQAITQLDEAVAIADGIGDRFLMDLAISGRGWAHVMQGEWAKAGADFERALALGTELGVQWIIADARVGLAMVWMTFGRFAEAERAARLVVDAEAALGLPALVAVATEIIGGAAYMQGRYEAAIEGLEAARTLYERHHLERGWGFLVNVEHAEAMLWLTDEKGIDAVPDLLARLEDDARRATRHMGRYSLFEGFDTAMWGVVASRKGQRETALKLFEKAEAERKPRASFLDTWMLVRIAFERLRLGAPRADVSRRLDEVAAIFSAGGIAGMTIWLARIRRIHGV